MITKADKGNTLIIILKDEHHLKTCDFITQNKFTKIRNNYTNIQQRDIKTIINTCKIAIRQQDKWKYTVTNPKAPYIHGTIQLHKKEKPIRPVRVRYR
jgi:hypothetical protein